MIRPFPPSYLNSHWKLRNFFFSASADFSWNWLWLGLISPTHNLLTLCPTHHPLLCREGTATLAVAELHSLLSLLCTESQTGCIFNKKTPLQHWEHQ